MGEKQGTRERILRAAEEVVLREGVARLTLEKAAAEAGLSKGGVLYHFPSRSALVAGMVERLGSSFEACLAARTDAGEAFPLAYVRQSFEDVPASGPRDDADRRERRLSAAVLAAAASEPDLLAPLREAFAGWQDRLETSAAARVRTGETDPDAVVRATVARFAVDGLWLCELFGFDAVSPDVKARLQAELERMVA